MPDLGAYFRTAPLSEFSGTVYRICPARYGGNLVSMRGSFLHGARYNIRGYFGTLYTSLSKETARREMARYFTVPPKDGFVEASISLRLSRVVDLTNRRLLRKAGIAWEQLIAARHTITQEIGMRAWESGIEGLLAPSAAHPAERNLAVFLDNQRPLWEVALTSISSDRR
ncbi:MAG: RES family NAD+ phosphorylase [Bryobacteraceae bacterium]|jgi:RES domain-containing protein